MKNKINFKFLILFNLTIIYFLKDFIFNKFFTTRDITSVAFLIISDIILNIIVISFSKKNLSVIKKFLIIAVFIGVIYIFVSPLLKGIDECAHFSRVYSFFFDRKTTNGGDYKVPKVILDGENNGDKFIFLNSKIVNDELVVNNDLKGARLYTPLSYLPFLIPVWIFRFFNKNKLIFNCNIC